MIKKMYTVILIALSVILLVNLGCKKTEPERQPETQAPANPAQSMPPVAKQLESGKFVKGQPAPDLSWGYGAAEKLSAVKGDVVMLNFLAPDVELCKQQLAVLKELWLRHNRTGLVIVGLVIGNNTAAVNDLNKAELLPFPYAWAGKDLIAAMDGLPALPTTMVIDRSGQVAQIVMGIRDLETWEVNLSPLLSSPAQAAPPPVQENPPKGE